MDNYIRDRMIIDAARVINLAEQQSGLEHQGLKGRFRELLVNELLQPWLPPLVQCVTGTVVSSTNIFRSKTQEDILLIDQQISPAVLIEPSVKEGVYLRNSVLARIEVKSSLELKHVREFKTSCDEFHKLNLDLDNERFQAEKIKMKEINVLFAFKGPKKVSTVLEWFKSETNGIFSIICIPKHGLWKITSVNKWEQYQCQTENKEAERLAAFTGILSNTAFDQHIVAQGRDRLSSLEGGIGQCFNQWAVISE